METIRASQVELRDRLIRRNELIALANITVEEHRGFYSPLTFSSHLLVNDLHTSVFSDR